MTLFIRGRTMVNERKQAYPQRSGRVTQARLTIEGDRSFIVELGYQTRLAHGPERFTRFDEEILPDPDPAWWPPQPGDVVVDDQRRVRMYCEDGWWYMPSGARVNTDLMRTLPYHLAFRNGQPWKDPGP